MASERRKEIKRRRKRHKEMLRAREAGERSKAKGSKKKGR